MKKSSLILAALLFFIPSAAFAIESICPGGASPRADIIWCADFETACADGTTDGCWTDNGFTSRDDYRPQDMTILTDVTRAVVGSRYAKLTAEFGSTGPGYTNYDLSPDTGEMRLRFYIRWFRHPMYYFSHYFGMTLDCGLGATRGGTIEFGGQSSLYIYSSGNSETRCFRTQDLHPNQGTTKVPQFKNGHYYLIEIAVKVDTSCTDDTLWNGCNGWYKIWVDGDLVIDYTNINWGGVTHGAVIDDINPVRKYGHKREPAWGGEVWMDQIVLGNDADTAIGAASGATNLGIAESMVYAIECGIEPFYMNGGVSYSPKLDYAAAGGGALSICQANATSWRSNVGTANASIYHTGVITDSASGGGRPYAEQSLRSQCTGANCGAGILIPRFGGALTGSEGNGNTNAYRNGAVPQWVKQGYIYIPTATAPTDKIVYDSFFGEGTVKHSNYVGFGENSSNGNFAIIQKHNDGTPSYVVTSSVPATRDVWHSYEIIAWNTDKFTLRINGVTLYDEYTLPNSIDWLFDSAHDADKSGAVVGITDYLGTGTVTAYHDDVYYGSLSPSTCDGWGTDCPFIAAENIGGIFPWLF